MIELLKKYLFSTRLMAVLFLTFGVAMAFGTIIETKYSTETARIWVYNATWFEAIMVFFVINFTGNMFRYRLFQWKKWPVLVLHFSWVIIIIGAFVTRYISFEGMMPIREGKTEKVFYSDKTFLTAFVDGKIEGELKRKVLEDDLIVTSEALKSNLPWKSDFNGIDFSISYVDFIEGAEQGLIPSKDGNQYLKIVEAGNGQRHDHYLEDGKIVSIHGVLFALNKPTDGAINIKTTDSVYQIKTPFEGSFMRMADQFKGQTTKDSLQQFQLRSLYSLAGMQFVVPDSLVRGSYGIVKIPKDKVTDRDQDALVLAITVNDETVQKKLLGGRGTSNFSDKFSVGGLDFSLAYGSKIYELPFAIKLNDFIAEKHPGSQGYKSFMSKVTVVDERPFDTKIYMNNVLDQKGYRFFQASFDQDEKGTTLSVNHDFWGTWITYIGYTLLYLGLIGIMFFGKTRFRDLGGSLTKLKNKKNVLQAVALLCGSMVTLNAQEHSANDGHDHSEKPTQEQLDSLLQTTITSEEHAALFGELVIQDEGGRMKPINTFSSELLRKLSGKDTYKGMNSDQVFISMMKNPTLWYNTECIALPRGNDSIRRLIGIDIDKKKAKAIDFFDAKGNYKLAPLLRAATATNTPNKYEKDLKNVNIKLSLLNQALEGGIVKIFPLLNDENNKWISAIEYRGGQYPVTDSLYANFIKNAIPYYLTTLRKAEASNDYAEANKLLQAFKQNQLNHGEEVLPTEQKIKFEIIYNKLDIFNTLFWLYGIVGILMFLILVFQILRDREIWRIAVYALKGTIIILFLWHTTGLIMRWYISGHAPWSDAYESIIFVAWTTIGMAMFFARKSNFTIAASTFVVTMLLAFAHENWVDPAIANLVPVLDSYWLIIHTAIIAGSYGPLGVAMILGFVSLLLMIMTTKKNKSRMEIKIQELTIINELALTVGLIMLSIGTFLGGQWANESWGRYWGWDPKETWALISIMVYAFVIHTRLVPGLRGKWTYNFLSLIAYASVMMTYFGVNYYLVGLHSYGQSGSAPITPDFIWYLVLGATAFGGISFWRYKANYSK